MTLGQLEGDGVALLLGLVAGLLASLWNLALIVAGAELLKAAAQLF
jgi:hypothetical protein